MLWYVIAPGCMYLGYAYSEQLLDFAKLCFISGVWIYCNMEVRVKRIMKTLCSNDDTEICLYHRGRIIRMTLSECISLNSHTDSITYTYFIHTDKLIRYFDNLNELKHEYVNNTLLSKKGPRQIISATLYDIQKRPYNVTPSNLRLESVGNILYTKRFVRNLFDVPSSIQNYTIHIMDDFMNEYTLNHTRDVNETLKVTEEGFIIQKL